MKHKDRRLPKQRPRLQAELTTTIAGLRIACEQWELGEPEQVTNLARLLRVLLYDYGNSSRSLFSQLSMKSVTFYSTPSRMTAPNGKIGRVLTLPSGNAWIDPTCSPRVAGVYKWTPRYHNTDTDELGRPRRFLAREVWIPFIEWWTEPIVWNLKEALSREELILAVANELGGTHAAPLLSPTSADLLGKAFGYGFGESTLKIEGESIELNNSIFDAAVRQIAFEVQRTVAKHWPAIQSDDQVTPPIPHEWADRFAPARVKVADDDAAVEVLQLTEAELGTCTAVGEDLRAHVYWHDYAKRLRTAGIL